MEERMPKINTYVCFGFKTKYESTQMELNNDSVDYSTCQVSKLDKDTLRDKLSC